VQERKGTEMIDNLKPYPAMKDSGVPWLGEVPEHWDVEPLGRSLRVKSGDMISPDDERENGVPIYGGNGIRGYTFKPNSQGPTILLGRVGAKCGCVHLVDGPFWASEHALRVIPQTQVNLKFLALVLEHADLNRMAIRTAQPLINSTIVRTHRVAFPPLPEQAAIVRFLDHADRRIRRYIRAKQKLIKLLEEQKQAIIHRAVTRGLDPNVRLKPSGVEWLGDVPEHWDVLPLCAIARPRKQTNQPHRELLSVYLGRGVIPFSAVEEKRTNPTSEDLSKYQVVEPGDFVLNNQQAWRGSVGVSRYQGIVSPAYLVLRLDGRLLVEFADRLLSGRAMVAQYLVSSKGVGSIQRNLYWPHLRRVAVLVPPAVEQAAIARYLNEATASLTTTIEREGHEIDLLREFRTRLITDVVTGKLDVREAAARLPDEAEEPEPVDQIEAEGDTDEAGADETAEVPEEAEA